MAKVFISYKYGDKHVRQNGTCNWAHWYSGIEHGQYLIARDHVTHLMEKVLTDHTNKAEKDDEDLSHLAEETIQQKLYDRIYDSSITIVLISKEMKEPKEEKLQWIPREISYSLREQTREDRTSHTNGIIAVALPDENGSYDYAVVDKMCGVRCWNTLSYFNIIGDNMFNRIEKDRSHCGQCVGGHHHGVDHSFIHPVKWDDFVQDHNKYIDIALDLKEKHHEFEITKMNL